MIDENADPGEQLSTRASGKPSVVDGCSEFPDEDGLFCTAFFDVRHQKVRVTPLTGPFTAFGKFARPASRATFG
ncbi:MAG: hypothetical protein KDK03_08595 [Rhodobacteraceae bacterium]|nr:hypothetical protein [Paracoccaceae bacterium]